MFKILNASALEEALASWYLMKLWFLIIADLKCNFIGFDLISIYKKSEWQVPKICDA